MTSLTCPECGVTFTPTHHRQTFCCAAHKQAFHHIMGSRGQVAMPLMLVWAGGRHRMTDRARYAYREYCALLSRWREDDKAAGRRPDVIVDAKIEAGWKACDL